MSDQPAERKSSDTDPKLLPRKAVLQCYEIVSNPSLAEPAHKAIVWEIFEHIDAQGRLLAKCGNFIHNSDPNVHLNPVAINLLAEIKKAMS